MNEISEKFFEDMAEDFFAECDELLIIIKQRMLTIDQIRGKSAIPRPVMEDLLRSCHTLKGLTGMIGAEEVMRFIHAIENYLRNVYTENLIIPEDSTDSLFQCVNLIEKQIEALRMKSPLPESAGLLIEMEALTTKSGHDTISNVSHEADSTAGGNPFKTGYLWKFIFTPSSELFEKGININEVRTILQKIGEIKSSVPKNIEDGHISFEFMVETDRSEKDFSDKIPEGVRYESVFQPQQAVSESENQDEQLSQSLIQRNVVRVDLSRLEDIMRSIGDLVISRSRFHDQLKMLNTEQKNSHISSLEDLNGTMERQLRELRESVMRLRLITTGEVFERMRFVVRDLIRESHKSIKLEFSGWETQIDKSVMEKMADPLLHLVRNAVAHGIESKEVRAAAGKPVEGRLTLRASAQGNSVFFEIEDDGAGIDREVIHEKAIKAKLIGLDTNMDDNLLLDLICTPGFTSREHSDLTSGRGIGMDVVRSAVQELSGSIEMQSVKGRGTRFVIQLPLTLSIVESLVVSVGDNILAVPLPVVNEVIRFNTGDLVKIDDNEILPYRDTVLPVLRLDEFFNLKRHEGGTMDAFVTGSGQGKVAIALDKILGQREIVVRTLTDPLVKVEGITGATELGEGKIVLILDIPALIRFVLQKRRTELRTVKVL